MYLTLLQPHAPVALLPAWSARLLGICGPTRAAMPVDPDAVLPVGHLEKILLIVGINLPSTSVAQKSGREPLDRTKRRLTLKVPASNRARPNVPSLYKIAMEGPWASPDFG